MSVNLGLDDELVAASNVADSATGFADRLLTLLIGALNSSQNPFGDAAVRDSTDARTGSSFANDLIRLNNNGKFNHSSFIPAATTALAGLLSAGDKSKLNGLGGSVGSTPITEEQVFDHVKNIIVKGNGINVVDSDFLNTITLSLAAVSSTGYLATAWASVSDDGSIDRSGGISSVSKTSNGYYTITFSSRRSTSNYAVLCACSSLDADAGIRINYRSRTTSKFKVELVQGIRDLPESRDFSVLVFGG